IFSAILLAPMLLASPAFAQPPSGFAVTATGTSFTSIPAGADGYGNIAEAAVWSGSVTGSPINGSFQMQEMRSHSSDGMSGAMQGQFTIVDGGGNSVSGTVAGTFTADASA